MAAGQVLAFLNNDMQVSANWLNEAVSKLYSERGVAAVQCKIKYHDSKDTIDCIGMSVDKYNISHMIGHEERDEGQYDKLSEIGACSGGAMLIRKDTFDELGRFDGTYFMYYEDVDLCWRMRASGYRIKPATASEVYHVGSASSKMTSAGMWNPSPFFAFEMTKNYLYCWLKNSRLSTIICCSPVVSFVVLAMFLTAILRRKPSVFISHVRGVLWILAHLKVIQRKRKGMSDLIKNQPKNILFVSNGGQNTSNLSKRLLRLYHLIEKEVSNG